MSKLAPFCPFFFSLSSVFFYTVTQSFTKAREILSKRRKKKYREENQINISKITLDITKKIFYYIYSPVRHTFSKAILLSPISDFPAQLYYILLNGRNKQMALTNWIIQGELRLFTMGVCRMYRKCKGQFSDPWLETAVGGYHSQA